MSKNYYLENNTVYYHDGVKTLQNNKPFYDVKPCASCKLRNAFIRELKERGYVERIKF